MKKSFFLSKGLDKFSNQQINDLSLIRGGAIPVEQEEIYYPTSGGGKKCPNGMVWSDTLNRCVSRLEAQHDFIKG
ncbi:conserved protein of unknown function [Tenacibaculum sp. 190130A14a]|uniref:Uncharacterized protein n=1 Tax=Tenacibaculum polynesiense TaxID=3137857 RepID=A0ABM9P957_9FLAO